MKHPTWLAFSMLIVMLAVLGISPTDTPSHARAEEVQRVIGDRIFDENGTEIMWRGAGASYLFHADDYQTAWEIYLREILEMRMNTMRLAFAFPDSTPNPSSGMTSADILDIKKLDWVIDFLSQHNIKVILDCHNYLDMYGDFGSQKLFADWSTLARHYADDPRVAAYELFNEPYCTTWAPGVASTIDVARVYAELTDTIRRVDPNRIVIWEAQPHLPPLSEVIQYFRPNIVLTFHRWWTDRSDDFLYLGPKELSYSALSYAVEMRKKYGIPFWFGEFGCLDWPFNATNPKWLLVEQNLWRCEEQAVGWNLWMGKADEVKSLTRYLQFFPLKTSNEDLARAPWNPLGETLTAHTVDSRDLELQECYRVHMWHDGDYIVLSPSLILQVIVYKKLLNGEEQVVSNSVINVTQQLTICNEEGTQEHPGDWDTEIFVTL